MDRGDSRRPAGSGTWCASPYGVGLRVGRILSSPLVAPRARRLQTTSMSGPLARAAAFCSHALERVKDFDSSILWPLGRVGGWRSASWAAASERCVCVGGCGGPTSWRRSFVRATLASAGARRQIPHFSRRLRGSQHSLGVQDCRWEGLV